MSMANSTTSITTPASATAGAPAAHSAPAPAPAIAASLPPLPKPGRWRFFRSLAAKVTVLALIFLAVPLIVYQRFSEADEAQKALLLRSVREQGRVMAQALMPLLADTEHPDLPQLSRVLARLADDLTNVKLLFSPATQPGFYYVASWPAVSGAELEAERDSLEREGVLGRLAATCEGDLPFTLRYAQPGGGDEIVTSVTPLRTPAGCWAVVTSFSAAAAPGSSLGRPYWESPEVRVAAAIYLAMVLLTFTTFWSIRRGLKRFAERAIAIRERRPGAGSFGVQNDVPELAEVAEQFDRMVEVLAASAHDIRRAAEDNAHAFKTPIAVIRQSLEPLKRAVDKGNRRAERAIGLIENSLDRLDGLVVSARHLDETTADLMDMKRSDIDLSNVLVRLLKSQADVLVERRIELKGHIRPHVMIRGNEEMVESVIENLFENALSFSPEGQSIGVRLEVNDGMAELLMGDSGPGVPADQLDRIFDRYFSERPAANSTPDDEQVHFGIGLWIVRRNVLAMGGTIQAENRVPHGLLMRVKLPLSEQPRLLPPT
jgi:two-component system, OmpR family, sensor histidine kinase ChvG